MNKQVEGQITFFDYLASLNNSPKANRVISVGQHIYKVLLCNIKEYIVKGFYAIGEENEQYGMFLESPEDASKSSEVVSGLGKSFFISYEDAKKQTRKTQKNINVIYAKDLHPISWKVYYYYRKSDGYKMYLFYVLLDNGYVYAKDNYTYHYMKKCSEQEARKHLTEQIENIAEECVEEKNITFPFRNMYQCQEQKSNNWLFTEAECNYAKRKELGYM